MLPRTVRRALYHLPERLALRFGRAFKQEGFKLVVPFEDRSGAALLRAKVVAGLRLIRSHSPKYYARVQKFVPNILIAGAHPYIAVYLADLSLCDISRDFALAESTGDQELALTLVHEATHGYLHSRGIPYSANQRARIERICVRAEIALARQLPQADTLITVARRRLDYEPDHWTDESFRRRKQEHFERNLEQLAKTGRPKFLIRWFQTLGRRRFGSGRMG